MGTYTLGELDKAIAEVKAFAAKFDTLIDDFTRRCAYEAASAVDQAYAATPMDGERDVDVMVEKVGHAEYNVIARGKSVPFLEWGAGVALNPNPVARPEGVLDIGEYGRGQGKNPDGWKMPDGQHTYGNPAAIGFVHGREAIETNIINLAQEVFNQ